MELKNEIYSLLRTDSNLQAKIMLDVGVSYATVRRWAVTKDPKLNQVNVLEIIRKHTGSNSYEQLFINPKKNEL